jgi:hypothetical protein
MIVALREIFRTRRFNAVVTAASFYRNMNQVIFLMLSEQKTTKSR